MAITDHTVQMIAAAQKFVAERPDLIHTLNRWKDAIGEMLAVESTARGFADALIELARPNKVDAKRVEDGDWLRVDGGIVCDVCGFELYAHPLVPGFEWLRRRCNGKLVKL